jgi:hypothetical protein
MSNCDPRYFKCAQLYDIEMKKKILNYFIDRNNLITSTKHLTVLMNFLNNSKLSFEKIEQLIFL